MWPCYLINAEEADSYEKRKALKPGAMWFCESFLEERLSPEYKRDWQGKRLPLRVLLPDGSIWCIDYRAHDGEQYESNGWTISGAIPEIGKPINLTASPSINVVGYYHGWLQNGILSEDCEGRKFDK